MTEATGTTYVRTWGRSSWIEYHPDSSAKIVFDPPLVLDVEDDDPR